MRAAEAQTAVLHPADAAVRTGGAAAVSEPPRSSPTDSASPATPVSVDRVPESGPGPASDARRADPCPGSRRPSRSPRTWSGWTPPRCCARTLADFLDAAGVSARRAGQRRRGGRCRRCPGCCGTRCPTAYAPCRAIPRPDRRPTPTPRWPRPPRAAVADAADDPGRRQLVVLLWDRPPEAVRAAGRAGVRPGAALRRRGAQPVRDQRRRRVPWVLARSRPGPRPSLLAHAGRLLDRWEAFAEPAGRPLVRPPALGAC